MDVYFYEAFEEEAAELKRLLPTGIDAGYTWKTVQESGDDRPPARFISTRTQSQIPAAWAELLDGILSRSTGYDHLQRYRRTTARTVPSGYLPLYCNRAVAEQALLLWMALLRKLPRQLDSFDTFQRDGLTGAECEGKVLAVVGVGNIGHLLVRIGEALGMTIWGVDLVECYDWVRYTSIDEALAQADVIVCAMNLTRDNVGYFDYDRLSRVRAGAVFVNVARGEMSPPQDLLRLLREGRLGGVALDVHDHERELAVSLREGRPSDDPVVAATLALRRMPNVLLTPHNAFNTREAVARKAEHSVQQVEQFLRHGAFLWPVPEEDAAG